MSYQKPRLKSTGVVEIKSEDIWPYHPLFKKLSATSVEIILPLCYLVRLKKDEVLYKQNKRTNKVGFIILYGFLDIKDEVSHRKIGSLGVGDTVGEEALLDSKNFSTIRNQT